MRTHAVPPDSMLMAYTAAPATGPEPSDTTPEAWAKGVVAGTAGHTASAAVAGVDTEASAPAARAETKTAASAGRIIVPPDIKRQRRDDA